LWHRIAAIDGKIEERILQSDGVHEYRWNRMIEVRDNIDFRAKCPRGHIEQVLNRFIQ